MENPKLSRAELQAYQNFVYGLKHHGLDHYVRLDSPLADLQKYRLYVPANPGVEKFLDENPLFGRDKVFLKSCHAGACASWREHISPASMQVLLVFRKGHLMIEVDYDLRRPWWDVVNTVGHLVEVVGNRIRGRRTDPFRVRELLNARGYGIPLVAEESDAA